MEQIQEKLKYKRTLVSETVLILAGGSLSTILDCGGMQPRALLFPDGWEDCNIFLNVGIIPNGQLYQVSTTGDGSVNNERASFAANKLQLLPLIYPDSDCFLYFQIQTDIRPIANQKITVLLQPLYQGIHG
jgi:hypothetical protein